MKSPELLEDVHWWRSAARRLALFILLTSLASEETGALQRCTRLYLGVSTFSGGSCGAAAGEVFWTCISAHRGVLGSAPQVDLRPALLRTIAF